MILNMNDEMVEMFLGWLRGNMVDVRTADETQTVFCGGSGSDEAGRWGLEAFEKTWNEPTWAERSFIIPWDDIEEIEVL